jgi:hypothetical protein
VRIKMSIREKIETYERISEGMKTLQNRYKHLGFLSNRESKIWLNNLRLYSNASDLRKYSKVYPGDIPRELSENEILTSHSHLYDFEQFHNAGLTSFSSLMGYGIVPNHHSSKDILFILAKTDPATKRIVDSEKFYTDYYLPSYERRDPKIYQEYDRIVRRMVQRWTTKDEYEAFLRDERWVPRIKPEKITDSLESEEENISSSQEYGEPKLDFIKKLFRSLKGKNDNN